jgi:hypothetical protein
LPIDRSHSLFLDIFKGSISFISYLGNILEYYVTGIEALEIPREDDPSDELHIAEDNIVSPSI